jgi:electron transfer flavoprotein beta subunit
MTGSGKRAARKAAKQQSAKSAATASATDAAPTRIVVLLRRLCDGPNHVSEEEVLGKCERAALTAALTLRGELAGEVTALAVGPASREDRVLAMALRAGCDKAVRVHDPQLEDLDYLGYATVLAAAVRQLGFDVVICGNRSQDELLGATGPAMAGLLGVPHLSNLIDVRGEDTRLICMRRAQGAVHEYRCTMPLVACVAAFPPGRRPAENDYTTSRAGGITELSMVEVSLDPRTLQYRKRFVGQARASRTGANATLVASPADLVAHLERDHVLGRP